MKLRAAEAAQAAHRHPVPHRLDVQRRTTSTTAEGGGTCGACSRRRLRISTSSKGYQSSTSVRQRPTVARTTKQSAPPWSQGPRSQAPTRSAPDPTRDLVLGERAAATGLKALAVVVLLGPCMALRLVFAGRSTGRSRSRPGNNSVRACRGFSRPQEAEVTKVFKQDVEAVVACLSLIR